MSDYLVGMDIGSESVKVSIGRINDAGKLTLSEMFKMPVLGIRRGMVQDFGDVVHSLSPVVAEINKFSKNAKKNIFLGISNGDIQIRPSIGVVAVSRADYEIFEDDMNRAIQSSQAINLPANRMMLHSIINEFIVDGVKDIKDPLGMTGNRLEVKSMIIDAFSPAVKSLTKAIETLGGEVSGIILGQIANSRSVLSKSQKELGVALVDIGFGKTSTCVYDENKLIHASVVPLGSGNITNDLSIGLKIPIGMAENLKLTYGAALSKDVGSKETIDLSKIDSKIRGSVSKKYISGIIEARLAEIMEFINNDLKVIGKFAKLPGGVVVVGGGAKIQGLPELVKQEMKLFCDIGRVDYSDFEIENPSLIDRIENPEYVGSLGLLMVGYEESFKSKPKFVPVKSFFRKIWKLFLP